MEYGSGLSACVRITDFSMTKFLFVISPSNDLTVQAVSRFLFSLLPTLRLNLLSACCHRLSAVLLLACSASVFSPCILADTQGVATPSQLAEQVQNASKLTYTYIVEHSISDVTFKSLKALKRAVSLSPSSIESNSLIVKNQSLLYQHIDDVDVFFFLKYLLDNNLYWAATELLQAIKQKMIKV